MYATYWYMHMKQRNKALCRSAHFSLIWNSVQHLKPHWIAIHLNYTLVSMLIALYTGNLFLYFVNQWAVKGCSHLTSCSLDGQEWPWKSLSNYLVRICFLTRNSNFVALKLQVTITYTANIVPEIIDHHVWAFIHM